MYSLINRSGMELGEREIWKISIYFKTLMCSHSSAIWGVNDGCVRCSGDFSEEDKSGDVS